MKKNILLLGVFLFTLIFTACQKDDEIQDPSFSLDLPAYARGNTIIGIHEDDIDNAAAISSVTFKIDGKLIGEVTLSPFEISFDSKEFEDGYHDIKAEVFFESPESTLESSNELMVDNIAYTIYTETNTSISHFPDYHSNSWFWLVNEKGEVISEAIQLEENLNYEFEIPENYSGHEILLASSEKRISRNDNENSELVTHIDYSIDIEVIDTFNDNKSSFTSTNTNPVDKKNVGSLTIKLDEHFNQDDIEIVSLLGSEIEYETVNLDSRIIGHIKYFNSLDIDNIYLNVIAYNEESQKLKKFYLEFPYGENLTVNLSDYQLKTEYDKLDLKGNSLDRYSYIAQGFFGDQEKYLYGFFNYPEYYFGDEYGFVFPDNINADLFIFNIYSTDQEYLGHHYKGYTNEIIPSIEKTDAIVQIEQNQGFNGGVVYNVSGGDYDRLSFIGNENITINSISHSFDIILKDLSESINFSDFHLVIPQEMTTKYSEWQDVYENLPSEFSRYNIQNDIEPTIIIGDKEYQSYSRRSDNFDEENSNNRLINAIKEFDDFRYSNSINIPTIRK